MDKKHRSMEVAQQAAREGAAHWLTVLDDPQCTDEERQQFLVWLRSSTASVEEFLRLSTLIQRLGNRELWPERDLQAMIDEARSVAHVRQVPVQRIEPERRSAVTRRWALAASLVGLAVAGSVVWRSEWFRQETFVTGLGEQRTITLADGSMVQLNTRSRASAYLTRTERRVRLSEGEAIFHVAKDPTRPFIVSSGAAQIVAVGTAFNVRSDGARTTITVLDGRVSVSGSAAEQPQLRGGPALQPHVLVASGEQVVVAGGKPQEPHSVANTSAITAWTDRRIIFENTPMSEAIAEFSRYSARRVVLVDAELRARKISGVFAFTDLESLVQFLANDPRVEVTADGDGWVARLRRTDSPL